MATFKEDFEDVFNHLDLFICLRILGLMLIWLMIEYLFRLLVKILNPHLVTKVRATKMVVELVALSKVILNQYQHRILVDTDNTDNKINQIFYTCNYLEVKLDGFSKISQRLASIRRISVLGDEQFGEGFPLQAMLPYPELGGSECVVVSIRKTAADFF